MHESIFYIHSSALQEAQDIFGLEFDLSEFDAEAAEEDEDEDDDDDDLDEEALIARAQQRKARRKSSKKSIYQVCLYRSTLCVL